VSTPTHINVKQLLSQLRQPGATPPSPADISNLLAQLLALLESLPDGKNVLDALKKPGAWHDKPLATSTPDVPIYVKPPCAIDFENVPSDALLPQLQNVGTDSHGFAQVTIVPPLKG